MTTLLQLKTSLFSDAGQSSLLADRFVARWAASHPDGTVRERDLGAEPVPHLTAARFTAFTTPADQRSPDQQDVVAYSDNLISELRAADVLVLGLPMYNFGIPSTLKAYFDHVARAGETFRYTADGPVGLLTGKKAYVFAARGGMYVGTDLDTQTSYVRNFLSFLGISDVEFVYAEGLAISEAHKESALEAAGEALQSLTV